jgi:hypothetical protein
MLSDITVKLGDELGILLLKNIHGRSPPKKTFLVDIPFIVNVVVQRFRGQVFES